MAQVAERKTAGLPKNQNRVNLLSHFTQPAAFFPACDFIKLPNAQGAFGSEIYTMADNIYLIDVLGTRSFTILADDGSGVDWLEFAGSTLWFTNRIDLNYDDEVATEIQAFGSYTAIFPTYPRGYTFAPVSLLVKGLIENARGANGSDQIDGNYVGNVLYGDHAATGLGGEDAVFGLAGNDTIYGGSANDLVSGGADNDILYGDAGADRIFGGTGNDAVYGGTENDLIDGGEGADVLRGGAGNDTINALDRFNDTVVGGAGADSMTGNWNAHDMVSYAGSNEGVNVHFARAALVSRGYGGHAEGDSIAGFTDFTGSGFGDYVYTNSEDWIDGSSMSNRFYGGGGGDFLYLGDGDDTGSGGAGNDIIDLGIAADRGDGGAGNDTLIGNDGNDTLFGGAGDDRLSGGDGSFLSVNNYTTGLVDRLYGGLGADDFTFDASNYDEFGYQMIPFSSAAADRDVIHDFKRVEGDNIFLAGIDADRAVEDVQQFTWIGSANFSANGQLRVVNSGANTLVQADLNGDLVADFSILVMGINNMIESDFTLV